MDTTSATTALALSVGQKMVPKFKSQWLNILIPLGALGTLILAGVFLRKYREEKFKKFYKEVDLISNDQVPAFSAGETNPMRPQWLKQQIKTTQQSQPNLQNKKVVVVDFSAHTNKTKGGVLSPSQLAKYEAYMGYDAVVVTDEKDGIKSVAEMKKAAGENGWGLAVLLGCKSKIKDENGDEKTLCVCLHGKIKKRNLVYNNKFLGCSRVLDPIKKSRNAYTVVFLDANTDINAINLIAAINGGMFFKAISPKGWVKQKRNFVVPGAAPVEPAQKQVFEKRFNLVMNPMSFIVK